MRRPLLLLAATMLASPALADSAATGYGGPGNVLNPAGLGPDLGRDPDGLSPLSDGTSRSPTGLLYPIPFRSPSMTQSESDPDWWTSGWVEAGVMGTAGSDTRSALLNQYGDWRSGWLLSNLGFLAENRATAFYVSGQAENVGRTDQFYQTRFGRYGVFDVTAFFDSLPHVYATQAKSLWDGMGTGTLTLRGGLTPGGSNPAQVSALAAAVGDSTLSVTREKAGADISYTPLKELELFIKASNEWRTGTQPISATFGYPFQNGATQIIQPVHYQTIDVSSGMRWKRDDFQANLTYSGSFFRNGTDGLIWQNPGIGGGSFIPTIGQLSLPPDNDYHTLKSDFAWALSPALRLTGSLSYSLMRQNDTLLAPTADSGTIQGVATRINLDQWNSAAALVRPSADAAIDIFNAFAQAHYTVSPSVNVSVELRDRDEKNLTNYLAYNPRTGQFGYIAIDGGLAGFIPFFSGVYEPSVPGSDVQIRNMPFANDNLQVSASGDWRLDTHLKLDLSLSQNRIHHSIREVPDADDDIAKLSLAATGYSWGSARLSYQIARRTGSDYQSNPYTPYYSASLPGYVPATPAGDPAFALEDLRKFDVANRTEHKLRAQTNEILADDLDLQIGGDATIEDYDASYGLKSTTSWDATTSLNYQVSTATALTGYVTWQTQNRGIANINPTGAGTNPAAGSAGYPLANGWTETVKSHDVTFGATLRHSWGAFELDADYSFTHSRTGMAYGYASTGAFFGLLSAAQAGTSFPDIAFDAHSLQTTLRWKMSDSLSTRLFYRFESETIGDFHYQGLSAGAISNNTYLGVVPENFTAHTVGLFANYAF
jgi:hypothetical protein